MHARPDDRTGGIDGESALSHTEQAPLSPAADVTLDEATVTEVWRDLLAEPAVLEAFLRSARTVARDRTPAELLDALAERDVPRHLWSKIDAVARGDRDRATYLAAATRHLAGGHSTVDDVLATASLFDALPDRDPPTVAVRVGQAFQDRRRDQREDVLALVATLARGFDVRLVATRVTRAWLAHEHREDLPGVSEWRSTARSRAPLADRVDEALATLDPDGREVSILRDLADEAGETLPYAVLYSRATVDESRVRQCIGRLSDLGLVDTFGSASARKVELLEAGRSVLPDLTQQTTLGDAVSPTGHPSDSPRVTPPAHEGPPEEEAVDEPPGRFDAAYLSRWHHAAAAGSAATADITAVDTPVEAREDPREPGWSFDGETLVVSVDAGHSALQLWVRLALGLANWRTFDEALTPADVDDVLGEHPRAVLRGARNLGFLKDEYDDGEAYVDALQEAAEHLRELTRKRHHGEFEDRAEGASLITRDALGLATLMTHLLDLAGVDVVREVRLPEFTRNYDPEAREELVRSLATGVTQQSTYAGHHVAYRHLYEGRPDRRQAALGVDVDATDPLGSPIGSWVLAGPGVDALEPALEDAVREPGTLHDDAPEFAVPVRVGTPGRPAFATVAREVCDAKNMDPTRDAVSVLEAFAGSPYDAARALHALQPENRRRDVRLDECRYALATLSPDRTLPDATPTVSKVVHALLTAEAPLSQAALADAADVSTRSVRRHADRLEAFDLVRETADGYRLALSFRDERRRDVLPWYGTANSNRDDLRDATEKGVLWEVAHTLEADGVDAVRDAFATIDTLQILPDVRDTVLEAWPWAGPLLEAARAIAADERDHRLPTARTVRFGADLEQASLQDVDAGKVAAG